MIVRVVTVLTLFGWIVGGFVTLSGLGASLWSILDSDFWGTVQGIAMIIWGIFTIQLSLWATARFVKTFAPNGLPEAAHGADSRAAA